jgi:hypothetical protein
VVLRAAKHSRRHIAVFLNSPVSVLIVVMIRVINSSPSWMLIWPRRNLSVRVSTQVFMRILTWIGASSETRCAADTSCSGTSYG